MNIGVSGASGHLGSATVRELKARASLRAKANIIAISRDGRTPRRDLQRDRARDAGRAGASGGGGQRHR